MNDVNNRELLLKCYEELLDGEMSEPVFYEIDEIFKNQPECVDILIEKFHHPTSHDDLETLAQIILTVLHYQPAIDYLKNELGWDDFTGYAGFPEC